MTKTELNEFNILADQYILSGDHVSLDALVKRFTERDFNFSHLIHEAYYLYILGNCYSELYKTRKTEWYSEDL
ncbi:hypothetical protein [Snodgrassella gandavensis]|uniref:hypothetical protein n=1 Tax=Snodgrassella gandavensis TaxID=2946698 RepID=UPI001EF6FA94|nr:hypothetical protein [Snodgrassella gandavensis]